MAPKRTQRTLHSEAVNPLRRSPWKQKSQLQAPDAQKGAAASRATSRATSLEPAAVPCNEERSERSERDFTVEKCMGEVWPLLR